MQKASKSQPLLILPLESYAREIDHKILLACFLSKATSCATLVAHSPLANRLANGLGSSSVYIGKNLFAVPAALPFDDLGSPRKLYNDILYEFIDNGVKIIFVDEEGGLYLRGDNSSEDYERFTARYPLAQEERLAKIPNFAMFHWGPYQYEIASDFSPNIRHVDAGANFIDAAKLYAGPFAYPKNNLSTLDLVEIGLTSNSALLSNGAFLNVPSVLGIEWQAQIYGNSMAIDAIRAESSLCACAYALRNSNLNICYRPHPGSSNLIAREWIEFCKSAEIKLSLPSSESSLAYLSRIQTNVHLGCTTGLQSYFLNRKTLKVSTTKVGTSEKLLEESITTSLAALVDSLPNASVPKLGPVAPKLLSNLDRSKLESFSLISDYISNAFGVSLNDRWKLRSVYSAALQYEVSRLKSRNQFKSGKYHKLHLSDVRRNIAIANQAWPTACCKIEFILSDSVLIVPS